MTHSRHSDREEVCNKCGQIRLSNLLRSSKNDEGQSVLVCKTRKLCGKQERIVIRALVRRTVKDPNGSPISSRRLHWVFKEIGNEQIKMTGPLLPPICPSLNDIKALIDSHQKLKYNEEGNLITIVCLDYSKYTITEVDETEIVEEEKKEFPPVDAA